MGFIPTAPHYPNHDRFLAWLRARMTIRCHCLPYDLDYRYRVTGCPSRWLWKMMGAVRHGQAISYYGSTL
jgi:hypothetical protein